MIVVMKHEATEEQIEQVRAVVKELGYKDHPIVGVLRTVIAVVGDERGKPNHLEMLRALDGVENVVPIVQPYKLASKEVKPESTTVNVNGVSIGAKKLCVIAGPCSVEDEEQLMLTAQAVKDAGASMLRGGAFKPRTSPYSFQGLGEEGLKLLARASEMTGLPIVTEVLDINDLDSIIKYSDMLQIGARNSQNYALLKHVGKSGMPVLLKRGMSTTINEFLMSAEYVLSEGNPDVVLCERGIRTFETATRNTFDLNAIPVLKERTHLPIVADPSHGTGYWQYVTPMGLAAIAAGADGLMIEVHYKPEIAASDGGQSLKPENFVEFMNRARPVADAVGREI